MLSKAISPKTYFGEVWLELKDEFKDILLVLILND